MINTEIGSEFWEFYDACEPKKTDNVAYLASGRTALDYILKDALNSRALKTAMLPSYCCDSMIEPFLANNIKVDFYTVNSQGINYAYNNGSDLVLLLDFFGYESKKNEEVARIEKTAEKIIVYDSTHKLNGNPDVEKWADYSFCSYRKWFYCNYAKAVKHTGDFTYKTKLSSHDDYVRLRNEAAEMKQQYINGKVTDKTHFLLKYNQAEELLKENYIGYSGVPVRFALSDIIIKRQINAAYLINKLSSNNRVNIWTKEVNSNDTPLFVPILIDPEIRYELRQYLASKNIFCPIHWPKTFMQKEHSDLYDMELSLICDQRYSIDDMERTICEIENFFRV